MEDIDMATSMVIGTQWGDEGKGKIVELDRGTCGRCCAQSRW